MKRVEKDLVTVIVPIYNTEKYLDHCIRSIADQTYRNLEILLIDDGSPDGCSEICDEWARRDNRIRVIHKSNEGLGMARNTGIENARGEYICFPDSDDFLAPDTIEKSLTCALKNKAEAVFFGFHTTDADGNIRSSFAPEMPEEVYRGEEVRNIFLPELVAPDPQGDGKRRLHMSACMMMLDTAVIRKSNWRFVSERKIISEDVYSLLELMAYVESVAVLSLSLYYYRTNYASISRSYRPDRYQRIKVFYTESVALCRSLGYNADVLRRMADPYLAFTLAAMKQEMHAPLPLKRRLEKVKSVIDDDVVQQALTANKKDHTRVTRRIMFWAMQKKLYTVCCFLLWAKK